jgi:hypothetical protein
MLSQSLRATNSTSAAGGCDERARAHSRTDRLFRIFRFARYDAHQAKDRAVCHHLFMLEHRRRDNLG